MTQPAFSHAIIPPARPAPTMHEAKPTDADAADVRHRSILLVIVLSAVTLFIAYPIYLCYAWARELNGLLGQVRHSPKLVLVLSIATLGIGGVIYECIFAQELERQFKTLGRTDGMPQLTTWVVSLNVIAIVCGLTAIGLPLTIVCGLAATCLVQAEFNKLAA
jgi:hypothetical protein